MKKKILLIVLLSLVMAAFTGCGNDTNNGEPNNIEGVTLTIRKNYHTENGLALKIQNESDTVCIFGSYYRIEKKDGGSWKEIPYADGVEENNIAWEDIGYPIDPGEALNLEVNWEWLYGELGSGEYRIVKDYFIDDNWQTSYYISAEFVID